MHRFHGRNKNAAYRLVIISAILCSIATWTAKGVESFRLESPSSQRTTIQNTNPSHSYHRQGQQPIPRAWIKPTNNVGKRSSLFRKRSSERDDDDDDSNGTIISGAAGVQILESIGLSSQLVVWISLYSLATTGHGLPAGPGGSVGAVEGIAYLVVVGLALSTTATESSMDNDGIAVFNARILSRATIFLGLLVLAGVAVGKGCVPNAKPILDYSAYLPVCGAEQQ